MHIARDLAEVPPDLGGPVVLALGTFDGVHVGHRRVIGTAVARARAINGKAAVVTFEPHPAEVLYPGGEPMLLTTLDERLALLAQIGVDAAIVLPFDEQFARMPAQTWLDEVLAARLRAREIVVGASYTFGHGREGTTERLAAWGRERGLAVHLVPAVRVDGEPVSSSRIRTAVRRGAVGAATRLLGRRYSLRGPVVRGDGRGRTIGFPTANLAPPARKVLPALGVYATSVETGERRYGGATNVGRRPTFGPREVTVETFLLDFDGDLTGREIAVEFVERIREERAFAGVHELVRQIATDVAQAQQLLARGGPSIIR